MSLDFPYSGPLPAFAATSGPRNAKIALVAEAWGRKNNMKTIKMMIIYHNMPDFFNTETAKSLAIHAIEQIPNTTPCEEDETFVLNIRDPLRDKPQ